MVAARVTQRPKGMKNTPKTGTGTPVALLDAGAAMDRIEATLLAWSGTRADAQSLTPPCATTFSFQRVRVGLWRVTVTLTDGTGNLIGDGKHARCFAEIESKTRPSSTDMLRRLLEDMRAETRRRAEAMLAATEGA